MACAHSRWHVAPWVTGAGSRPATEVYGDRLSLTRREGAPGTGQAGGRSAPRPFARRADEAGQRPPQAGPVAGPDHGIPARERVDDHLPGRCVGLPRSSTRKRRGHRDGRGSHRRAGWPGLKALPASLPRQLPVPSCTAGPAPAARRGQPECGKGPGMRPRPGTRDRRRAGHDVARLRTGCGRARAGRGSGAAGTALAEASPLLPSLPDDLPGATLGAGAARVWSNVTGGTRVAPAALSIVRRPIMSPTTPRRKPGSCGGDQALRRAACHGGSSAGWRRPP